MTKKLTILVHAIEGVGHVNACTGLATELQSRGHKIIFVVDQSFKGRLAKYGFNEELLENTITGDKNPGERGGKKLIESGLFSPLSSYEKGLLMVKDSEQLTSGMVDKAIGQQIQLKSIIDRYNPDLFIIDSLVAPPSIIYSGKPWVFIWSANPMLIASDDNTPPYCSGYASNGEKTDWKAFKQQISDKLMKTTNFLFNEWLIKNGFPKKDSKFIAESPYLNLYGYPEELDYTDIRPVPKTWFRVDSFCRKGEEEFKLPEKLREREGKLIYFSLGSMGCINVSLMKRLVNILSKSKHRFIVSKGVFAEKYELADNMWGDMSVPQTKVIPLVDLVITHGGNNSVNETFSFGKPMVVLPLCFDQFDNAQRVHEKGFGVRLDPYLCSEEELLNAIEMLLNDKELKERLTIASKRIENDKSLTKAAKMIENQYFKMI